MSPDLTVAVVGGGPRALWALERIASLAGDRALRVDVLCRDGLIGAGPAYEPLQPPWLRLNVAASSVDVWAPSAADGARGGPSYDTWREEHEPGSSADAFPPRALTGTYLHAQAQVVLERLGPDRVTVHRRDVRRIDRLPDGRLALDAVPGGAYDHVLVVTGHEQDWPGALHHGWAGPVPLHPRVFPVTALQARPEVRPGATVVVRGAALTAIDAVLALTHGPAGHALRIVLTSRTGRLMHPKTERSVLERVVDWDHLVAFAAGLVADRDRPLPEVLRVVAAAALGGGPAALACVDDALADLGLAGPADPHPAAPDATAQDVTARAGAELRRALAVARGEAEPDGAWALGQAWRAAYPALVCRQEGTDPTGPVLGWPDWQRWARALERLAFGPPPVNGAALLDLLDSGVVEVRRGDAATIAADLDADLVVDAVLAPPGVRDLMPGTLLAGLVDAGLLTPAPHGRGALVDGAARALDAAGRVVPGLAVAGRATEDVVIGNDTLVRSLHPHLDRWARDVLGEDGPRG